MSASTSDHPISTHDEDALSRVPWVRRSLATIATGVETMVHGYVGRLEAVERRDRRSMLPVVALLAAVVAVLVVVAALLGWIGLELREVVRALAAR